MVKLDLLLYSGHEPKLDQLDKMELAELRCVSL
jgi:hypothetical protein